eukprot:CAMPEP_0202922770 /NCGR_PEP_ID=MMETSP1392-20130828/78099_1 /ASSEMBLY_ACC=CAM_ASM_000868 /TAXON_ID=225041 /ORGANISM="Chlamydomonas chlamydogama, Strain SAG 11-48b" /LENGTH=151 /DNA_ID=CAMNT_0049616415 /DNA_START=82 /DNA_END=540 /DNA_ORIENTATION=+
MDLAEMPSVVFDTLKYSWSFAFGTAGIASLVAGEWFYGNMCFGSKPVWDKYMVLMSDFIGLFTASLSPFYCLLDTSNARLRRGVAISNLVGAYVGFKSWKNYRFMSRGLTILHVVTSAVFALFKPKKKAAKAAESKPTDTKPAAPPAAPKK